MNQSHYEMVREFHIATDSPAFTQPMAITQEMQDLRMKLIDEELDEVVEAMEYGNMADIAKELADLLYVVYGTAATYGINMDVIFPLVHQSNMSKLVNGKPIIRKDGKVLKGPFYQPPDIESALSA